MTLFNLKQELKARLAKDTELESQIEQLRIFKREKLKPLEEICLQGIQDLNKIMEDLSDIADSVLSGAYSIAEQELERSYGRPIPSYKNGTPSPADLALIGMGKLGGRELHFNSDLDILFIFNHNGTSEGPKNLTHQEYFAKLTQRMISYLSLHTRYGYAYAVDTELRPSGKAGALVTPLDPWIDYYHEHAQLWEKQALLKARLVRSDESFSKAFEGLFHRLIFSDPLPENFASEIHRLRLRIEKELAKETSRHWNLKKGHGGLMDIEFAVQYLQLKWGAQHPHILSANTLKALELLQIFPKTEKLPLEILKDHYVFFRKLEIYQELISGPTEGHLDPESPHLEEVAPFFGCPRQQELVRQISQAKTQTRDAYLKILEIELI